MNSRRLMGANPKAKDHQSSIAGRGPCIAAKATRSWGSSSRIVCPVEHCCCGSLDLDVGLANDASVLVILRVDKGTKVGPALAHRIEPESQELRFDLGRVH